MIPMPGNVATVFDEFDAIVNFKLVPKELVDQILLSIRGNDTDTSNITSDRLLQDDPIEGEQIETMNDP